VAQNPDKYSFSRVTTFEQCARRFRYRYLDGVKEGFQGVEAFMGQQVHAAVEWLFERRASRALPSADEAVTYYCDHWDQDMTRASGPVRVIKDGIALEFYRRSGAEMLSRFYRERFLADRLQTIENEKHFVVRLGESYDFQGYIDRLATDDSGLVYIIDYKTGSRVPKKFEGKEADQLEAYAMAIFRELECDEIELVLEFLKTGARLSRRVHRAAAEDIERKLLSRISVADSATVFPPTPGVLCDWCGYNDLCESATTRYRAARISA
jgi:RecB family exonuclease